MSLELDCKKCYRPKIGNLPTWRTAWGFVKWSAFYHSLFTVVQLAAVHLFCFCFLFFVHFVVLIFLVSLVNRPTASAWSKHNSELEGDVMTILLRELLLAAKASGNLTSQSPVFFLGADLAVAVLKCFCVRPTDVSGCHRRPRPQDLFWFSPNSCSWTWISFPMNFNLSLAPEFADMQTQFGSPW